jgi:uncharacterized membrane protein
MKETTAETKPTSEVRLIVLPASGCQQARNDQNLIPATLHQLKEHIMQFDSKSISLAASAFAAAIALPLFASAAPAPTPQFTAEKCFGVAAASQNDCQTAAHSCAGESKQARDANSWVYVPVGTCAKIAGGSLKRA